MAYPDMEQIYLEYHDKVSKYIRARVQGWADAEDLCADVFEKIQRRLPNYDPTKAAVGTWIFTITRNTVIDFFRRTKPTEELDESFRDDSETEANLLTNETLGELAAAMKTLPPQMRDILVLRYYDGKPLTDIAKIMGLSYGAVKLRHQSALAALRQQMKI